MIDMSMERVRAVIDKACQDWFDDENDALIAGMEEAKRQDAHTIVIGKVNTFHPAAGDYAGDLLEYLQDAACEECSYVRRGLKPGDLLGFDTDEGY